VRMQYALCFVIDSHEGTSVQTSFGDLRARKPVATRIAQHSVAAATET